MKQIKNIMVIFCVSLLFMASSVQAFKIKPLTFIAVEQGDINQLRVLLKMGANVNEQYQGISLLNKACGGTFKVDNEIVKLLLDAPGINVKTVTITTPNFDQSWATTPLIALISSPSLNSKVDNVIKLIKMGVNVNYHSAFNNGGTALWLATFGKQNAESKAITMAILNNAGSELNMNFVGKYELTAYRNAVQNQHLQAVELILKRGAWVEDVKQAGVAIGMIPETVDHDNYAILDVIMKYSANKYGPSSKSRMPLNAAMVSAKYADWADYFITNYNVNVNHIGKAGSHGDVPAINEAASNNNVKGLSVLFKHGADVNLSTSQGINAIQLAAQHNSLDATKYLIANKAKLNGYNSLYFNAISYAALGYHLDILDLLVKNGADINAVSKKSPWAGPLARIAMGFNPGDTSARLNTLNKLLKLGANPNVLHAQKMTAMMCAAKLGSSYGREAALDNAEILMANGADLNLRNTSGETALMMASATGNLKLVDLLIERGAKVNTLNNVNESALSYASRAPKNKRGIIKALKNAGAKSVASSSSPALNSASSGLVGTWKGYQSDYKMTMATFVVNKNNSYSYSAETKSNGRVIMSISHKGKIVASANTYSLQPEGQASAVYSYKIVNGKLSVNNGRPLDKIK